MAGLFVRHGTFDVSTKVDVNIHGNIVLCLNDGVDIFGHFVPLDDLSPRYDHHQVLTLHMGVSEAERLYWQLRTALKQVGR